MSSRNACLLQDNDLREAIRTLLEKLDQNQIQHSLKACIHCLCGLNRNTVVNMHGQFQSLHYILTQLLADMDISHEHIITATTPEPTESL